MHPVCYLDGATGLDAPQDGQEFGGRDLAYGLAPSQGNTSRSSRRMIFSAWLGTHRGGPHLGMDAER